MGDMIVLSQCLGEKKVTPSKGDMTAELFWETLFFGT